MKSSVCFPQISTITIQKIPLKNALENKNLQNNQKLLWGVQGGGFLEKSPPGRRRQKKELTDGL